MIHMKHTVCYIPKMKMKMPIAMVNELFSMFLFNFFSKGSNAWKIHEHLVFYGMLRKNS